MRVRAVRVWAVSWAQARKLPCAARLSAKAMSPVPSAVPTRGGAVGLKK